MENEKVLAELRQVEATARRMKSYTAKQVNVFFMADDKFWNALPVSNQVLLQSFYEKILDLANCATVLRGVIKGVISKLEEQTEEA